VQRAGLVDPEVSASAWTFADAESRSWWAGLWADRVRLSAFAEQAVSYGLSDADELDAIADAWRQWATRPDGFFMVPHVEVIARPTPGAGDRPGGRG